jgi:hypothetical protein
VAKSKENTGNIGGISVGSGFKYVNLPTGGGPKQEVLSTDGQKTVRLIGGEKFVAISLGRVEMNPPQKDELGRRGFGAGSTLGKPKRGTISPNSRDRSRGDYQ